ncbi:CapA family protein [Vreelandella nigrificans]|uniref:ATP-grasp domain-containing protein n=1 Tax=Vreelandella nigrificans TaxID=2042704 RepID=A0A2A4HIA8_9GAMM|nr:CapA family protein [Halomonas nigrificans]PCF93841.1 hypothetical protein CPA45_20165 [Halomonas nigrificans]
MTKPFKITFCGDTSLGYYYLEKSKNKYPEAYQRLKNDPFSFFEGVAPLLEGSDEIIVNLETVLTKKPGEPIEGKEYPGFDDPDVTIDVLKKLRVTAVTLANNHTMDFGEEKLVEMIDLLHANGIATIGAGRNTEEARKPYVINLPDSENKVYILNGMRARKRYIEYGFFAKKNKPGIASTNVDAIKKSIDSIRKLDVGAKIIVIPHWQGIDYKDVGEAQQKWCEDILTLGADMIVGHGSHKKDKVIEVEGKNAYLSIGNFVFNAPGRYASMDAEPYGLVPTLELKKHNNQWLSSCEAKVIHTNNKESGFRVKEKGALPSNVFNVYDFDKPFSTSKVMSAEFEKLGFDVSVNGRYLAVKLNGKECQLLETETSFTSLVGFRSLKDKDVSRELFARSNVNVANGRSYKASEKEEARLFFESIEPAVLKPLNGNKGKGVSVNVGKDGFDIAWDYAAKYTKDKIIVEDYFNSSQEARYLVVDGKCVAVSMRIPPYLVGDGESTISSLVDKENLRRRKNPNLVKRPLLIDESRKKGLESRGYNLNAVLEKGKELLIDSKANLSTGAHSMDITDLVHPSMKAVAEKVSKSVPGLDIIGVDILSKDYTQAASEDNYIVVEANTRPGIGGHIYPSYGKPINVAEYIAHSIYRKLNKG